MTEREALIQEITEGIEAKRRAELPPEQQQQQQKYMFGGREWNSQQEAEAAALAGYQQRDAAMRELELARAQASRNQPAPTQLDTGRAPAKFDSEAYLKKSLEDPKEAHRMVLRDALFGDPNHPADPYVALQNMMLKTIQLEQQADQQRVRSEHPEIPWGDENAERLIAQQREKMALPSSYQGTHAAIRELQGMGVLPNRRDLQAWQENQQKSQPQPINARKDVLWSTVRQEAAPTLAPLPSGGGSPGGSMSDLSEQQLNEFFDLSKNDLGKQREFLNELRRRAVGRTA